jgi:hypothetical protein
VPLEVIGKLIASLPVDVYIRRIEKVFADLAEARAAKKAAAKAKPLSKVKPKKKAVT